MATPRQFLSFETVSLIVAFAILASAGMVTVRTEAYRREAGILLRHTLNVENTLLRLDGAIRRAESEERGYLITRDPAYFSLKNGPSSLGAEMTDLENLVADNPNQVARVEKLRPLLRERLELLQRKFELMKDGRFDEAVDILRNGRGKTLMDQIDALIRDMIDGEEKLFSLRDARMIEASESLQTSISVMIVLLGCVATFAVFMAHRQFHALRKSSASLQHAYNELIEESTKRSAVEAQLRQSQKLEALGQLAGGIAHDFNNMLGVIVASLNIMRRKLARHEDGVDQLISSAMDGADRAAGLVRRLLAFSRIQPLNPTPLDVNDLVSGMSAILHRTLGSRVELSTILGKDLWPTKVDPNELESAIVNLAVNARDAMPEGGRLTIETGNAELDAAICENDPDARPGEYVVICVSDTGHGMSQETLAKAFDPFFTTKPIGKGTGLGLSQVHGFVRQSGGHIKIYSEIGHGAAVKLYLPRYVEESEEIAPPPPPPKQDDFLRGTPEDVVLLVEDDDTARRVTAQGVRELGYTVIEAANGKEAIRIIRDRADIALLITDVVMPEMDGARLAREAVFRRHSLHVLFITGYSKHAVVRNGMLDPDVNLLTKPFTLVQLARKIREALVARADLSKGKS